MYSTSLGSGPTPNIGFTGSGAPQANQYMDASGNPFDYVNNIASTPANLRTPWQQQALQGAQTSGANVATGNQFADSSGNSWNYIDRIANTPDHMRKPWEVDALAQAQGQGADIAYSGNTTPGLNSISQMGMSASTPQTAQQVTAPNPIVAGQLSTTNMEQYMSPYTQQVTDVVMSDLDRQNQILGNQMDASAMQAGAFGGSRHGVANAETNRAYLDQVARTSAGLNQDAYNTGLQSAQFDIGNRMGADQFNTGTNMQAQLANQGAANNMSQFNSGLGMQNAQFQSGLQNLGFGQQQTVNNNMMNQGSMLQAQQQALIDAAKGQYGGFANSPQQSLATILSAISGVPSPISTTEEYQPGVLDYASAAIPFFCWVAREVYGADNPEWLEFREWMLSKAPAWFRNAYMKHGPKWAAAVKRNPWSKRILRPVMDWLKG